MCDFYNAFCEVIGEWRSNERKDNERCWEGYPQIVVPYVSILHYASRYYTIEAYKVFQKEFTKGMSFRHELLSQDNNILIFLVRKSKEDIFGHVVTYDEINNNVCCTCKRFEEKGFLCRHILRIYHMYSVETIPTVFMLNRWTRTAKPTDKEAPLVKKIGATTGAVWRLQMQRKFHKLLCASDENYQSREICNEMFDNARFEVEKLIGNIYFSDEEEQELTLQDEDMIANPKGRREKYTSNERAKSILEIKTTTARKRKQTTNNKTNQNKKQTEDEDINGELRILPYFPVDNINI